MAIKSQNVVLKCDFGSEELCVESEGSAVVFSLTTNSGVRHSVYVKPDECVVFMSNIEDAEKRARAEADEI